MKFSIHKHIGGEWSICHWRTYIGGMCWDEMLSEIAQHLLNTHEPDNWHRWDEISQPQFAPLYSLRVSKHECDGSTIRRGDRFINGLGSGEALGFLAAYTLTDGERQLFGGLLTYEQWSRRQSKRYHERTPIAGLITYQPEHVA